MVAAAHVGGCSLADQATQVIVIDAPPQACFDVATDFERYPDWAGDVKEVTVIERDPEGRGVLVQFRTAAFGRSTSYTLRYDYSEAPNALSWVEVEGDLTSRLDGTYVFAETAAVSRPATEVTYHLEAQLKLPIPGFVKRRAEGRIMHTALRQLKARVEAAHAG
jgi:ribosome-associated toxin RatA of RatAB toxin-antitoxin module